MDVKISMLLDCDFSGNGEVTFTLEDRAVETGREV